MSRAFIPIDSIDRRKDCRPSDHATIEALADSIEQVGLISPIRVRQIGDRFELIAGSHRYAACDSLNWREIPAEIVVADDAHAELAMIDENLCRAEVTGVLRDQQIARRKVLFETLHPGTRHGGDRKSDQVANLATRSEPDRFTAETAALTGQSERSVQRSAERGEKIVPEAASLVHGTKLDKGVYLDKLKHVPPDEQVKKVAADLKNPPPPARKSEYLRIYELSDALTTATARDIIADCPPQKRAELNQRVSSLIDLFSEIMEGSHA